MDENFCYIVDEYNKFQPNNNVIRIFKLFLGGKYEYWCIRKIPITYNWGIPQLNDWVEQDFDKDYSYQYAYSTEKEAMDYVKTLKRSNG